MGEAIISRRGSEYTTITFSGTQAISKDSTTANLSSTSAYLAATYAGNYALFGGGFNGTRLAKVSAFNTNGFARIEPEQFSIARADFAAAHVGNYALFAGGLTNSNESTSSMEVYNQNLTHSSSIYLYYVAMDLAGVSFGNYAIFAGGYDAAQGNRNCKVNCYNSNLSRTMATDLTYYPSSVSGSCNANYAIFAGGYADGTNSQVNTANAYNSNLTRSTPTPLFDAIERAGTATAGKYALFVGGRLSGDAWTARVTAYDTNLVRTSTPGDGVYYRPLERISGTSLGSQAIFAGGKDNSLFSNTTVSYDSNLTRNIMYDLFPMNFSDAAATSLDGYALFGGGRFGNNNTTYYDNVTIFGSQNKVQVYPGTVYKLGSMTNEETSSTMQTITTESPISGYVKIKNTTIS